MRALAALTLVVACLCAGCGTSGREADAGAVVTRFQTALAKRDGATACAQLSKEASSKLEQEEKRPCEQAILELGLPTGRELSGTSVYVTSASVSLRDGGPLFLDESRDGWEISAAGCRPTTPERPYDCDLEG